MVAYVPNGHNKNVQGLFAISDSISHNATVVYRIIQKIFPTLKRIHYLTDSLSSHYRNKTIFHIICDHEKKIGVSTRWSYLETGHGKRPCDWLGASAKRMAFTAIYDGNWFIDQVTEVDEEFCQVNFLTKVRIKERAIKSQSEKIKYGL